MSIEWRGMSRRQFPDVLNTNSFKETVERMTREEIEKQMDNLARKYVETHDPEIIEALYQLARLARELEKMEKLQKQ